MNELRKKWVVFDSISNGTVLAFLAFESSCYIKFRTF